MKRIEWIDIAKGLGIFLVVLGHTSIPSPFINWIYSFHMPLFFFISGYLFNPIKHRKVSSLVKHKAKTILIPYIVFSLITYVYWLVRGDKVVDPLIPGLGIFYSNGSGSWLIFNVVLWFLTCLFVVEISFFLIARIVKSTKFLALTLIVFSVIGFLESVYVSIRMPWSIDVALTAVVFYGVGYLMKSIEIHSILYKSISTIALISLNVTIVHFFVTENADMNNNYYGNYFTFYIAAFSGIFGVLLLSQLINSLGLKLISYIGRNSLIVLSLHLTLVGFVGKAMRIILHVNLDNSLFWCIGLSLITAILLIPIIYIFNKYLPFITGKTTSSMN